MELKPSKSELPQVMADMWARIDATEKISHVSCLPSHPRPRAKHLHINFMHRYHKIAQMWRVLFAKAGN